MTLQIDFAGELYTVNEFSYLTGISETAIYKALAAGKSVTDILHQNILQGLKGDCCPSCGAISSSEVVESRRKSVGAGIIRRRRACRMCDARFTTYEVRADSIDNTLDRNLQSKVMKHELLTMALKLIELYKDDLPK